jgi:hypothetical protein
MLTLAVFVTAVPLSATIDASCNSTAHSACSAAFQLKAACGSGPASFIVYDVCTNRTMCQPAISPSMRDAVARMCSAEPSESWTGSAWSSTYDYMWYTALVYMGGEPRRIKPECHPSLDS